jgi:hypothetical protein
METTIDLGTDSEEYQSPQIGSRTYVILATIPQNLVEGLSFNAVQPATPKITAKTKNTIGTIWLWSRRKAW